MEEKLLNLCEVYGRDYSFYKEILCVLNRLFIRKHDKKSAIKSICKTWHISPVESVAIYDFWVNEIVLNVTEYTTDNYVILYNNVDLKVSNLFNFIELQTKWNTLMSSIQNVRNN